MIEVCLDPQPAKHSTADYTKDGSDIGFSLRFSLSVI